MHRAMETEKFNVPISWDDVTGSWTDPRALSYMRYSDDPLINTLRDFMRSRKTLAKAIWISLPTFDKAMKREMTERTRKAIESFLDNHSYWVRLLVNARKERKLWKKFDDFDLS